MQRGSIKWGRQLPGRVGGCAVCAHRCQPRPWWAGGHGWTSYRAFEGRICEAVRPRRHRRTRWGTRPSRSTAPTGPTPPPLLGLRVRGNSWEAEPAGGIDRDDRGVAGRVADRERLELHGQLRDLRTRASRLAEGPSFTRAPDRRSAFLRANPGVVNEPVQKCHRIPNPYRSPSMAAGVIPGTGEAN